MDSDQAQRQPTQSGLFGGLKKLLFKDEEGAAPPDPEVTQPAAGADAGPHAPANSFQPQTGFAQPDSALKDRAYQMLESINQPGVDFMEVWNAAEDNGGANPASVKAAFNALKYADKSLTREKVLATGRHYCGELQRAFDADAARKSAEKQQIQGEKTSRRQSLSAAIAAEEAQIAALTKSLAQKRDELARMDADYDPRLQDIDRRIEAGRATVAALTDEMRAVLRIVETEL